MDEATAVLQEVFGHPSFRPGQREAVDAFLQGEDVVVLLPTGGGKSLCYQVPAILRARWGEGPTLVVSPLIALMSDQVEALRARGVPAVALHSGLDAEGRRAARSALEDAALVYVSPERLARPAARKRLARLGFSAVAIDEAHCISQWGHDFRPDYMALGNLSESLGALPTIALTATATPRVRSEIAGSLALRDPTTVVGSFSRANLQFTVEHIQGDHARTDRAAAWMDRLGLGRDPSAGRVILYAATRKRVVSAAKRLRDAGFSVDHYHGGRTAGARANAQARFAEGQRAVMVATSAFGMGIDLPDVRMVLHLAAPGSLEAYYQEAGRAGRDGEVAHCVLLYAHADARTQAHLRGRNPPPGAEQGFKALQDYAFGVACRQGALVHWFTGTEGPACGTCDVCRDAGAVKARVSEAREVAASRRDTRKAKRRKAEEWTLDASEQALILRFVDHLRRPVGKRLVALGLKGSRAKRVRRKGLAKNPAYGELKGVPEDTIVRYIEAMLADGRLVPKGRKYPTVWMPDKRVRRRRDPDAPRKPRRSRFSGLAGELSRYRRREARRRKWKTYQVFDNATLKAMAEARPRTLAELEAVPGMGPKRVSRYGEALLRIIGEWDGA